MGLRSSHQSKSCRGRLARLKNCHERAARSGVYELAEGMVVRTDGVHAIVIVRSARASEQDAAGSGGAGESGRLADCLRESTDRYEISRTKSRRRAAARRACRDRKSTRLNS